MIYIFGFVLLYSGYKLLRSGMDEADPSQNKVVKMVRRLFPISPQYVGGRFIVSDGNKTMFTPLILALIAIESTDVVFAFDSVPAVIDITEEFFTAYTSNIMAILG
ncbi:MAG: hypothetical protein QXJ86_00630 [Nitrososphaerales archaeon]